MKYLALLFALFVTAAQAETILMQCTEKYGGISTFRYSDGLFGWGTPKYEKRGRGGTWHPFCTPKVSSDSPAWLGKIECVVGDKGIERKLYGKDGKFDSAENLDFLALSFTNRSYEKYPCKRLN